MARLAAADPGGTRDSIAAQRPIAIDRGTLVRLSRELRRWGYHYNQGIHALNSVAYHLRHGSRDRERMAEALGYAGRELSAVNEAAMDATREAAGNDLPWRGRAARTWKHYVISPDPRNAIALPELRELACSWAERWFPDNEVAIVYHDDNPGRIPHAHVVVNNTCLSTGGRRPAPSRGRNPGGARRGAERTGGGRDDTGDNLRGRPRGHLRHRPDRRRRALRGRRGPHRVPHQVRQDGGGGAVGRGQLLRGARRRRGRRPRRRAQARVEGDARRPGRGRLDRLDPPRRQAEVLAARRNPRGRPQALARRAAPRRGRRLRAPARAAGGRRALLGPAVPPARRGVRAVRSLLS